MTGLEAEADKGVGFEDVLGLGWGLRAESGKGVGVGTKEQGPCSEDAAPLAPGRPPRPSFSPCSLSSQASSFFPYLQKTKGTMWPKCMLALDGPRPVYR